MAVSKLQAAKREWSRANAGSQKMGFLHSSNSSSVVQSCGAAWLLFFCALRGYSPWGSLKAQGLSPWHCWLGEWPQLSAEWSRAHVLTSVLGLEEK